MVVLLPAGRDKAEQLVLCPKLTGQSTELQCLKQHKTTHSHSLYSLHNTTHSHSLHSKHNATQHTTIPYIPNTTRHNTTQHTAIPYIVQHGKESLRMGGVLRQQLVAGCRGVEVGWGNKDTIHIGVITLRLWEDEQDNGLRGWTVWQVQTQHLKM